LDNARAGRFAEADEERDRPDQPKHVATGSADGKNYNCSETALSNFLASARASFS
jgi:hypothetical protein